MIETKVKNPDGSISKVRHPEGASQEQILAFAKKSFEERPNMPFVNQSIAETLGGPVDLVASALGVENPFGGSASIQRGMRALGVNLPKEGEQPYTAGEFASRGIGMAAGGLLPFGAAAKGLQGVGGVTGQIAGQAMQTLARSPVTSTAAELGLGATSGLGGYAATQAYPDSPTAQMVGEILGGLAPAPALSAALSTYKAVSPVAYAARKVGSLVEPFTPSGGQRRAERRVQDVVLNPEQSAADLRQESIGNLSPAQMTGDEGLLAIERRAAEQSPVLGKQRAEQMAQSRQTLQAGLNRPGDVTKPRELLESRREQLTKALEDRANQAVKTAEEKLAALNPVQRQSQASVVVRDELEAALKEAKAIEGQLWASIPNATIPTIPLKNEYVKIIKDIPKAQYEDIPVIAQQLLDPRSKTQFQGIENVQQLQGLRSKLLEDARQARAAGQYNKARIADAIADAVLDTMGAQASGQKGPVGQSLRNALDFSRTVREKFNRGSIGRVLSPDRVGGDRIAPEMTLEAILGAGKVKGNVGLETLLQAADTPQVRAGVRDYFLERLNQSAVKNGVINPEAAERFVRQNDEIISRFPELRDELSAAVKAQKDLERVSGRRDTVLKGLSRSNVSATAQYLNAPVGQEISAVLRSQNPRASAANLRRLVSKSPEALQGLRASAYEYIVNQAKTGNIDEFGNDIISGLKMQKILRDPRVRSGLAELVGTDGVINAERIASELAKLEKAQTVKAASKIIDDTPNSILSAIGTTLGARFGAKLGAGTSGASLKTASFFSNKSNEFLKGLTGDKAERLIIHALDDKELLSALLTDISPKAGKSGKKLANQRLNAWLSGPIGTEFEAQEETE